MSERIKSYRDLEVWKRGVFALGSLAELETQALIALRIGLLPEEEHRRFTTECDVIGKMLRRLQKRLGPKPYTPAPGP